ncbi:MAG: phosphatase PAP2 family protein [Bacteriovoracaceae bacterium]|nr:phosphatase PAP2 family protein [Bacteriovoracaceae bacterium]
MKFFSSLLLVSFCLTSEASVKEELLSPVQTEASTPFYIGAGITLTLSIFEDAIVDPAQQETVENKPLGSFSGFGDAMGQLVPNVLYMTGMYWHSRYANDLDSKSNARLMFKATLYATMLTTLLKYTIREPRPNGEARNSFPSGHTTTAFAFASVVAARHNIYWGVGAYSIATIVAYSRMNDNAHYVHDVVAGATIGIGYGLGLHYLEKKQDKLSYNIIPIFTKQKSGIYLVKNF